MPCYEACNGFATGSGNIGIKKAADKINLSRKLLDYFWEYHTFFSRTVYLLTPNLYSNVKKLKVILFVIKWLLGNIDSAERGDELP